MYAVQGSSIQLRIIGCPESQPAPRYHQTGGRTCIYNAAEHQQTQLRRNTQAALGMEDGVLFFHSGTNLVVEFVEFFMPRPQYHFLAHRSRCFENLKQQFKQQRIPVGQKPDIDNLEKFLFDSLEGVIFDDKCIVQINHASKFYDDIGDCRGCTIVKMISANDYWRLEAKEMKKKAHAK
jgi:Holliday junction resolvase RusA-like endonuclease